LDNLFSWLPSFWRWHRWNVHAYHRLIISALRAANDKLLDELAAKNPLSKEIIKSRHDYLQKIRAWTNISDKAYLNSFD
jgi:TRAP-type mannitol/chloroaromatic compound transport system substrate-binding protein